MRVRLRLRLTVWMYDCVCICIDSNDLSRIVGDYDGDGRGIKEVKKEIVQVMTSMAPLTLHNANTHKNFQ